ncbi:hypothetical protein ACFE04_000494 [Oxalis oulophora]
MAFTIPISLMCCCVVIFLRIETALATSCYDTGNFTANGTYSKNRDTLLTSLASNAAIDGFYNSSVRNGSDTVYATAMCRGDASPTDCSTCVNSTALDIIRECPLQYEAISWAGEPECVVHYANKSIFGVLEMEPSLAAKNVNTISWNSSGVYDTWIGLVEKLKNEAASGTSRLKYAVGKGNLTQAQYIYAMVQCTPDLSKSDCNHCLWENLDEYEKSLYGYGGGIVRRPNCIFRWGLDPFYDEVDDSPPPSPLVNGGTTSGKKIAIIVGSGAFFVALVAVVNEDVTGSSEFLHWTLEQLALQRVISLITTSLDKVDLALSTRQDTIIN